MFTTVTPHHQPTMRFNDQPKVIVPPRPQPVPKTRTYGGV